MTPRGEHRAFLAAAFALWLVFFVQAVNAPILLDDWFQLRYWRDHELGLTAIWAYARHNYFHYNPRIGEVFLAIVDGCRAIHLMLTPLVQLAVLPAVFVIAFGRWPRRTLRDLELLLVIQTLIWLVIPIPGIMYFYRPFATNYLWAFTITLALFVPYRLALAADSTTSRPWLAPIMLVLGWVAGMCNEHTGPTAMVAMAGFVYAAWRLRRLRVWMLAGMVGLYVGYPMLFLAPGQAVRYGGIATRDTPTRLLSERGITGCFAILRDFIFESRLGILVFVAAAVRYAITIYMRGDRIPAPPRRAVVEAIVLAAASVAIVVTLFVSPTATDRVFYASGVLLVAAFAVCAKHLFVERVVRRFVVGACIVVFGYHVVRFVETSVGVKAENEQRLAILRAARPGSIAVVPSYGYARRSRWHLGDDFQYYPWLRDYVGGELFDLARIDLDRRDRTEAARFVVTPGPVTHVPTYRELQSPWTRLSLAAQLGSRFTITAVGLFDDPRHRPLAVLDATPTGQRFVDGRPYDDALRGHFIRVQRTSLPTRLEAAYVIGCEQTQGVALVDGDDPLLPVDERYCRGPFTAILCEPDRCWVAGWY
ncbi:MAG: hypothetical protein JWO36_4943 [Myxococcales bacterium]|nr:hypothetical protein [Myxococcales bacterium]